MHPAITELMEAWKAQDDARPRSRQKTLGMSSLGGCARRAYHELRGDAPTNETKRLGSLLGTAFHAAVEGVGLPGETEIFVQHGELTGHVDRFHDGVVRDWKFTKRSSIEWIKKNGPSQQYRWQIQMYAHALCAQGDKVDGCWIVFIPRDGDEDDCYVWEEDYDPSVAEEALAWLLMVEEAQARNEPPEPEKAIPFCRDYCPFYGLCPGAHNAKRDADPIDDEWLESAARSYWTAGNNVKQLATYKEQAAGALEGVTGRYGDYLVTQRNTRYGSSYPYVEYIGEE